MTEATSDARGTVPACRARLSLLKGAEESLRAASSDAKGWLQSVDELQKELATALNARNVAFLLGAGCSSHVVDASELGIPTMAPLSHIFVTSIGTRADKRFLTVSERVALKRTLGIDVESAEFASNLERLLESLYAARFMLGRSVHGNGRHRHAIDTVAAAIRKIERYVLDRCTTDPTDTGTKSVRSLYESFYRKLVFRDRALPRPWVFTTNYDLFNEAAMDRLGLPYTNGFSGTVERRFNPASFRYALAEQLDLTNRKWNVVDGFVYLCKLHGSISWVDDGEGLYSIRELQQAASTRTAIIYPTPAKHGATLGSPYSDLFREFQGRIVREQSVLFVIGYTFGDEHLNNIIFQALSVPTFRLIVFAQPAPGSVLQKLADLGDPRVWIVNGETPEGRKAHYFDVIATTLLPERPSEKIDVAVEKVIELMAEERSRHGAGAESNADR